MPANRDYFSPWGINDSNLITGYAVYRLGVSHLSTATTLENGTFVDHGFLSEGQNSQFKGINNIGQSVGISYFGPQLPNAGYHAVIGVNGSLTDIGTLGGYKSWGEAINDNGIVTGGSYLAGDQIRHIFYGNANGLTDIGTLGGDWGYGRAINNADEIVGDSQTSTGVAHAFYFDGLQLYDLNELLKDFSGWDYLEKATGISDTGFITGYGKTTNGETHSFILTIAQEDPGPAPVPEPATFILLGSGLAGLAFYRRKRK